MTMNLRGLINDANLSGRCAHLILFPAQSSCTMTSVPHQRREHFRWLFFGKLEDYSVTFPTAKFLNVFFFCCRCFWCKTKIGRGSPHGIQIVCFSFKCELNHLESSERSETATHMRYICLQECKKKRYPRPSVCVEDLPRIQRWKKV